MITVQDVLNLAIETDMNYLAHRIFWAVTVGEVNTGECSSVLDHVEYDEEAINKMIDTNLLDIGKVKLFVASPKHPEIFMFYFSENVLEAHALHQKLFNETPKRLIQASHLLGKVFEMEGMKESEVLYFHRRKIVEFPYYLGFARAGERLLNCVSL